MRVHLQIWNAPRMQVWNDTQFYFNERNPKRVYYLSMEFLMGRSLLNALFNLDVKDAYTEALRELGYDLEDLIEQARAALARFAVYLLYLGGVSYSIEGARKAAC
jgi:glucan phosphorylase